jgi:hypothetical protein
VPARPAPNTRRGMAACCWGRQASTALLYGRGSGYQTILVWYCNCLNILSLCATILLSSPLRWRRMSLSSWCNCTPLKATLGQMAGCASVGGYFVVKVAVPGLLEEVDHGLGSWLVWEGSSCSRHTRPLSCCTLTSVHANKYMFVIIIWYDLDVAARYGCDWMQLHSCCCPNCHCWGPS